MFAWHVLNLGKMNILCSFCFDFGKGNVDVVGGQVFAKDTCIFAPLGDVHRRSLSAIGFACKLLKGDIHDCSASEPIPDLHAQC